MAIYRSARKYFYRNFSDIGVNTTKTLDNVKQTVYNRYIF